MIQRKQTLFLLAAILIHLLVLFVPVITWQNAEGNLQSLALLLPGSEVPATIYFKISVLLNAAALLLSFTAIFLYTRRSIQKLQSLILSGINVALALVLIVAPLLSPEIITIQKNWVIYLPVLNILFCFLAARFIQKDIDLLKSADRIR